MADKGAPMVEGEPSGPPNPLLSVISKFTQVFNFRFPPPTPTPTPAEKDAVKIETESKVNGDAQVTEVSKPAPAVARFPDAGTTSVPPLKLEADEVVQDTNPVVLWQIYAIGGFFVLKWVIARWKERRANKKPSNEDSPPQAPPAEADE